MFKNQRIMKCFMLIGRTKNRENSPGFVKVKDIGRLFLPIIFTFLFISFTSAQVVTLGDDIAICKGDIVSLSDLNPVNTATGVKSWGTSGDGIFNPDATFANAVTYTPGANDKANGKVTIYLYGVQGTLYQDEADVFIQDDVLFACNDNVTLPLNFHCEYHVTPPMVLEGEDSSIPYSLYDIEIKDADGNIIPNDILTGDYIGQTLVYTVTHQCSWNACSGLITIQDNFHPIIDCGNDTVTCQVDLIPDSLGFPIDTSLFTIDTIYRDSLNDHKYTVEGWDACGDVILTYQDEEIKYECSDDLEYQQRIVRKWKAVDESGNISQCNDTIMVERIPVSSVILPPNWNNVDTNALSCDGAWLASALPNGNPSPDFTGWPELWSCSSIEYRYEDSNFPGCGNTFDVVRKWTIIDWCNTDSTVHYTQIIKIMDTVPPVMICVKDTVVVGSSSYECNSELYELEIPEVTDNCSSTSLFVKVYSQATGQEVAVQEDGSKFYINHLPLGFYRVEFKAIDDCNRISKCSYIIKVIDNVRPYMICDQHTKVNLGTSGEIRLEPGNVDDGSFDNCSIVKWEIRKMTYTCDPSYFEFGPYVGFCCDESGDTLMVEMRATDQAGNFNSCMVEVLVEDKLPPQIICPPDIYVSCDFYFNPDDLDKYFGTVVIDKSLRKDIIIHDIYNNGVIGQDGYAYDNCDVRVESSDRFDINNCNIGKIYRTFTAIDNGGRTNPCLQTITITNPTPFNYKGGDIVWPKNTSFTGCSNLDADTSITGVPQVNDNMCSMVAIRYEDQLFSVQGDACKKIIRKWEVRDWCQSDYMKWTHEQTIMLNNYTAPEFTSDCQDRDVCVYGECSGLVELSASATDDCTPAEDLLWRWKLDLDGDGTFDEFGQSNHFTKTMDEGKYTIVWIVEDRCGNENICEYDFTVKDCKKPTPYCITDLTTVVMNQVGMVTMDVNKFDHGSLDNCTPQDELLFSFSSDVNDTLYNITCDSLIDGIARTFYLKMWVTDNAGNQEHCDILLRVEGNGNCEETTGGLKIGGIMTKWTNNDPVKGISLKLTNSNPEFIKKKDSGSDGRYEFSNLQSSNRFELKPKSDNTKCLDGVTTSDIVVIQKHLLGIKSFNNVYQYIAADVNGTESITAGDILDIRKLILGRTNRYKKANCWEFVDAKQQLTKHNALKTYKNKLIYDNLNYSVDDADFKVIKMGDLNSSFDAQGLMMRGDDYSVVELENIKMDKGKYYTVPVYAADNIEGIQFTIDFNEQNLAFAGFESGQADVDESNFGLQSEENGIVTFSWNVVGERSIDVVKPLFYIKFNALNNSSVSHDVDINSSVTPAISVKDGVDKKIVVKYRNKELLNRFEVYQNTPNPFNDVTFIKFNIPESEKVVLEIYNLNGKMIYNESRAFEKGINDFKVSNSSFSAKGVYYYTIKVAGDAITKKMILIN